MSRVSLAAILMILLLAACQSSEPPPSQEQIEQQLMIEANTVGSATAPPYAWVSCTDTDGRDHYASGKVVATLSSGKYSNNITLSDRCFMQKTMKLLEVYCKNGSQPAIEIINCDCKDGVCKRNATNATTRPFLMGSSQWPPDFDLDAIEKMFAYKSLHTDLFVYHQVAGVPWQEAYDGAPYPKKLQDEWGYLLSKRTSQQKTYIALSALAPMRTSLAPAYKDDNDNTPLAAPWSSYDYDDPHVKQAFLNYAKKAIDTFKPDYVLLGIETNILANDEERWQQYIELHKYVYGELKRSYPSLPIGAGIQYEHMQGLVQESKGNQAKHEAAIKSLLPVADFVGVSTYPYVIVGKPVPENYLDKLYAVTGDEPLAFAETGYASATFKMDGITYEFAPEDQQRWMRILLQQANDRKALFVVNWATEDFEKLNAKLPPSAVQEAGNYWMYTGLIYSNMTPKPAAADWDRSFATAYSQP